MLIIVKDYAYTNHMVWTMVCSYMKIEPFRMKIVLSHDTRYKPCAVAQLSLNDFGKFLEFFLYFLSSLTVWLFCSLQC